MVSALGKFVVSCGVGSDGGGGFASATTGATEIRK